MLDAALAGDEAVHDGNGTALIPLFFEVTALAQDLDLTQMVFGPIEA